MPVVFTAHNIRLDDGTCTKPDESVTMESYPWFLAARRVLDHTFPGDKSRYRIADLGCLEGGYAVEFARLGFQTVGLDVRESNLAACEYVKARTHLPNLEFRRDNALNIAVYGSFDAVFCCGLLYHLENPYAFLETLGRVTRQLLILQTHFSVAHSAARLPGPPGLRKAWARAFRTGGHAYRLSRLTNHEGLEGQWYTEFSGDEDFARRETARWSSWDNRRSFWIRREHLVQAIRDVGFDFVAEEYSRFGPQMCTSMTAGDYHEHQRGMFVGVKS
ncbi:MAG TPA: class I SAM-dependent methyltransferase [Candidatus Didemnitutus sp.]|nr:class I SAM-dependent methyltransferase [Candidatus Didemnitutus sp.]